MSMVAPVLEHQYNGDLLTTEHDQELARREHPSIYHVLDHPELRGAFQQFDEVPNRAKLWVHRIGIIAVLLSVFALVGSALTPTVHQIRELPEWIPTSLFLAEVGGVVGLVIAAGGMLIAGHKSTWLQARMMAEVLRQWHFQSLICRGKDIEASCGMDDSDGIDHFRASRELQFQKFLSQWAGSPDSHLMELVDNPEAGY